MLDSNTKEMKSKATVGSITVWGILLVSLAATLAYWYVLAGLETATGLSSMWMTLLWVSVAVGLVAEVIKKVTLSTFRNKNIWLAATVVSVLTVIGTYSILNQARQNDLVKQSDSYQDSRATKKAADFLASQYAYAAGYDLEAMEQELDQVIVDRDNRKIKYNTYLSRKKALEEKIEAKRNYDSAVGTSNIATANMSTGGSDSSSNPLLSSLASVLSLSEGLITMLFYLFVTILLEVAAFWIGGEVEKIKQHMKLTEAELLDMKNQELFGFSVRDVQRDLFDRVRRSQQDAIDAEYEVQQIRRTRKDEDSGKQLPSGEVAANVNQKRYEADESQLQAKQEPVKAESPTLKNDVPENVSVASREEFAPAEAKPEQKKSVGFDLPKNAESTAEKNRKKYFPSQKRLVPKNDHLIDDDQVKWWYENQGENSALKQAQSKPKASGIHEASHKAENTHRNQPIVSALKQAQSKPSALVQEPTFKASSKQAENEAQNKAENESLKQAAKQEDRRVSSDTSLVYPEWRDAVIKGECGLTLRGSTGWVKKHLGLKTSKQVKDVTDDYASQIVELCYMRGLADDVIIHNPKWKEGSRIKKYLIA